MTLDLKNIWDVINRKLTTINAIIWGLATWDAEMLKNRRYRKIPLVFNILLLFILLFLLFIMTYGSYRRQTD